MAFSKESLTEYFEQLPGFCRSLAQAHQDQEFMASVRVYGRGWGCVGPQSFYSEITCWMTIPAALFIILILGATGVLSSSTLGWSVAGVAGGGFFLQLAGGKPKARAASLILSGLYASLLVTLGCLGGAGVLSGASLITALFVAYFVGGCCFINCGKIITAACLSAKAMTPKTNENETEAARRRVGSSQ